VQVGIRTGVTDEALMVRAQEDDGAAFAELYHRYAAYALDVASAICRDPAGAEEVVQDGFFSIWRSREGYRPQLGSFEAWSMRIVHNRAVDWVRVVGNRPRLQPTDTGDEPVEDVDADEPFDSAIAAADRIRMLDSLRRLPTLQAQVVVLSYYGDFSLTQIASRLGLPAGTVKGRMRLGLEKLRGEWLTRGGRGGQE
jgi:RNA polymerase sigma-70 factor (ECF subfamily)